MLSILVAYTKNNRVIGAQGKIPWNLSSERNRFKAICNKKTVIMGRKTFEEIGHALPYCTILIVSKSMDKAPQGCILAKSLEQAFEISNKTNGEVLVAGGEEIYKQTLSKAQKIYATEIEMEVSGDTFFPELDSSWQKTFEEIHQENEISYKYLTFEKIK